MQYVHFTSKEHAETIAQKKVIIRSSIFANPSVFAVAVGGSYVPGVQQTKLGRTDTRDWAVVFETERKPDIFYPEEVIWRTQALRIQNPQIMPAAEAARLLDGSLVKDDELLLKEFINETIKKGG